MKCQSVFIFSNSLLHYRFHPSHPFNQKRIILTKDLLEAVDLLTKKEVIKPRIATEEEIALFHDQAYINAVKQASNGKISKEKEIGRASCREREKRAERMIACVRKMKIKI